MYVGVDLNGAVLERIALLLVRGRIIILYHKRNVLTVVSGYGCRRWDRLFALRAGPGLTERAAPVVVEAVGLVCSTSLTTWSQVRSLPSENSFKAHVSVGNISSNIANNHLIHDEVEMVWRLSLSLPA
jgi:hypothetical protein